MWITAIREEKQLATSDHSTKDWEVWDQAVLKEQDAGEAVAEAREEYEDALRKSLLNF